MITISQCSDNKEWSEKDNLMFQIYNGKETTYTRADTPTLIRSLGREDYNKFNNLYSFYYKEKK